MSWYGEAMGFIKKQKIDNPEMPHDELRKHCSKNYPFGMKQGYAYKAFLEAMRDEFGSARRKKIKGQVDAFD